MLEAWSRTRDGTRKLSANFTVAEFACKDGSDPVFVDSSLAALLQKIRDHFGRPVVITSGYRSPQQIRGRGRLQPASVWTRCRHPGAGHPGGAAGRLCRDLPAWHRRHRPVPAPGRTGCGLGPCGHPPRQKPLDRLRRR